MDRRRFLKATAATAGAGAALSLLPESLRRALELPAAASGSLDAIEHVVIFMQENRSFDHYYGTMSGVRGYSDTTAPLLYGAKSNLSQPHGTGTLLPFHVTEQCMNGTPHDWATGHTAANNGRWDQWVAAKGTTTMAHYQRSDLGFYHALADAFTLCDGYHCSVLGPTNPNRMYLWTGMIDPNGTGGGPVIDNAEANAGGPVYHWTTYPERLQNAGVSWKVYQEKNNYDDNALDWFGQFRDAKPGTPLHDRALTFAPDLVASFKADIASGALPRVSWIVAPDFKSEHPYWGPGTGATLTSQLLDALASNQAVWSKTVFLLMYDENDGFFDHLPGPLPPAGTADEFVKGLPIGLGVRVPLTVVSPFSRGGYVCSETFDHTSVLRFLEAWTGVKEPNISAWRRAVCGDLTSALDLKSSTVTWPSLPAPSDPGCSGGVSVPPPGSQSKPVQDAGTRPARPLPYQPNGGLRTDKPNGKVWIDMVNGGTTDTHFAVYSNRFRTDGPYHYDVAPGKTTSDYWRVQLYGGGKYDLSCHGPNRFLRRYIGDLNASGVTLGVSAAIGTDQSGTLTFTFKNSGSAAVTVTVTANAYRTDGPWPYSVPAGGTVSDTWHVGTYNKGWYDLSVTVSGDASFSQRFVGHVENGAPSVTG